VFTIFFADCSLSFEFRCTSGLVNWSLSEFTSIRNALPETFFCVLNFVLNTCISLFSHEFICKSYLCGMLITKILVCLWFSAIFFNWRRPFWVLFLPTSFVPPHTTTTLFFVSSSVSFLAVFITAAKFELGFTRPWTSLYSFFKAQYCI